MDKISSNIYNILCWIWVA